MRDLTRRIDPIGSPNLVVTPEGIGKYGITQTPSLSSHLNYSSNFSFWCRFYVRSSQSGVAYQSIFGRSSYSNESNNKGWDIGKGPTSGGGGDSRVMIYLFNNQGGGFQSGYRVMDSSLSLNNSIGKVIDVVGVHDTSVSARGRIYTNGRLASSSTDSPASIS